MSRASPACEVGVLCHDGAELATHGPDHLFEDLSRVDEVWEAICRE